VATPEGREGTTPLIADAIGIGGVVPQRRHFGNVPIRTITIRGKAFLPFAEARRAGVEKMV
jgi:hypothetical protein